MATPIVAPLPGTITTGSWVVNQSLTSFKNGPAGQPMRYNYLLPFGYSTAYLYPVLMYGHWNDGGMNGGSYPGDGTNLINGQAGPAFNTAAYRKAFPSIVIVPMADQSLDTLGANPNANFGGYADSPNSGWNEQAVTALLQYFIANFSVDITRLYATGDSLGAIGSLAWLVDNNDYNGAVPLWTAAMGFSEQLYRPATPNNATLFERMRNVPYIAVSTTQDNVPASYDQPAWTYYAGNSSYPSPAAFASGGVAAIKAPGASFYYFDNGSTMPWNTYRNQNADGGQGTPLYTLLFSFTSGTATPPPPPPPSTGGTSLVATTTLAPAPYGPFTVTASNAAIIGSPFSLPVTVNVTGAATESQAGTLVTSAGPSINASPTPGTAGSGNLITITTGGQVAVNGTTIASTGNVAALYYIGHSCFQENTSNSWYGPVLPGDGGATAVADPRPALTLSNATVTAGAVAGSTVGILSVSTGAGSYTWSYALSGTGSSNFQLSGATLQTHAPLTAGSYGPFTVTATNAAILGSPFSLQVTVIAGSVTAGANFSVSGGKILDPNGVVVVPKGVNVFDGYMSSAANAPGATPLTTLFPGINWVRLPTGPGSNNGTANAVYPPASTFLTFVQYCTGYNRNSNGTWTNAHTIANPIMVCIEDHNANSGVGPYSGAGLTLQLNWYAACAAYYLGNPYVCFGTQNEMGATDSGAGYPSVSAAYPASNAAIYNAVRNTGNNTIVQIGAGVGGSNQGTLGPNAGWTPSTYAPMHNIIWEIHCYYTAGDVGSGNSYTNVTQYIAGTTKSSWPGTAGGSGIIGAQTIQSADGVVPVIVGEYGSDSGNVDGSDSAAIVNGLAAVRTQYGGVGSTAWIHYLNYDAEAWNLTSGTGAALSGWGTLVSNMIKNSNP